MCPTGACHSIVEVLCAGSISHLGTNRDCQASEKLLNPRHVGIAVIPQLYKPCIAHYGRRLAKLSLLEYRNKILRQSECGRVTEEVNTLAVRLRCV